MSRQPNGRRGWIAVALYAALVAVLFAMDPWVGLPFALLGGFAGATMLWATRLRVAALAAKRAAGLLLVGRADDARAALPDLDGWVPAQARTLLATVEVHALARAEQFELAARSATAALVGARGRMASELRAQRAYASVRANDASAGLADAEHVLADARSSELARAWARLATLLAHDRMGDRDAVAAEIELHGRMLLQVHAPRERRLIRQAMERVEGAHGSVYRLTAAEREDEAAVGDDLLAPVPSAAAPKAIAVERRTRGQRGALLAVLGAAGVTLLVAFALGLRREAEKEWEWSEKVEKVPRGGWGLALPGFDVLLVVFCWSVCAALVAWLAWFVRHQSRLADALGDVAFRARLGDEASKRELLRVAAEEPAAIALVAELSLVGICVEEGRFDDALAWADRALALSGITDDARRESRASRAVALACMGRSDEAEAEIAAAADADGVELRRYAVRLLGHLSRGDLASAARLAEARGASLALSERFELLGALARIASDPVLARSRDLRWAALTWDARPELRAWVELTAPSLARILAEREARAEAKPDESAEAEREALAEGEAEERARALG